jgi:hypothetical protein
MESLDDNLSDMSNESDSGSDNIIKKIYLSIKEINDYSIYINQDDIINDEKNSLMVYLYFIQSCKDDYVFTKLLNDIDNIHGDDDASKKKKNNLERVIKNKNINDFKNEIIRIN